MELITKDGMHFIHEDHVQIISSLKDKAYKVRLSIIKYNRTKDENSLNSCCRNCGDIIKLIDKLFM